MARVLFHTLVFPPDGVSTAYLMGDVAREIAQRGHRVTVLTTTPHYNVQPDIAAKHPLRTVWPGLLYRSDLGDVRIFHIKVPKKSTRVIRRSLDFLWFHAISMLAGLTAVGRQDVVIAPSPPLSIGMVGWALARLHRAKAAYNVQELYPDFAINQGVVKRQWLIYALRALESAVYRLNDVIVTISVGFSSVIAQRGVRPEKIVTIPNFADTDFYKPMPRRNWFSREHRLDDSFVVLYAGNIGLSQDWDALLLAAAELRFHPIVFLIMGDGARRPWLEREVLRLQLTNVRLLGYQPMERVPDIYAACDLCTIPMKVGTTTDTFPSKIYTIMACERPVVVQADPGSELEQLVWSAGCGTAVPAGSAKAYRDAIARCYAERSELTHMGKRGRAFVVERYSRAAIAERYCDLIAQLTGHSAGRGGVASTSASGR